MAAPPGNAISATAPPPLLKDKHIAFVRALDSKRNGLMYHMTEHLRMNGVYWGLCSLALLDADDVFSREDVVSFIQSTYDDPSKAAPDRSPIAHAGILDPFPSSPGGFAPFPGHDTHVHSTLSAIQVLALKDAVNVIDKPAVIRYILSLRATNGPLRGAFFGDASRLEHDTRFLYCAIQALKLLGAESELSTIRNETVDYILLCHNSDGGFGPEVGAESHSAMAWTCLATLSILDALDRIDADQVGAWLSDRQLPNGGLNGRPQKLEDVCYSWWVLSSLSIVQRLHWIDAARLRAFILSAQDPDVGGLADRPDNVADVFHTLFGIAGLSLLAGLDEDKPSAVGTVIEPVDPTYCLPVRLTHRLGIVRPFQQFRQL